MQNGSEITVSDGRRDESVDNDSRRHCDPDAELTPPSPSRIKVDCLMCNKF